VLDSAQLKSKSSEDLIAAILACHLPVATCIGCGARNHSAECPDRCPDLPLDLVDVPRCGRIDAPRPCLGNCVSRPGTVADMSEHRQLSAGLEQATTVDLAPSGLATTVANVTPGPGCEELTATLRSRARELLDRFGH
jgi:hypothetical protein